MNNLLNLLNKICTIIPMLNPEKDYLSGLLFSKPEILDVLINYLKSFDTNLPILSIGSGNGYVEYCIKEQLPNYNVICIDPDPESFNSYHPTKHIKPSYNYLSDVDCNNYLNCILFINWPNPNNNGYDIESVIKLKPRVLCVSYAPCGAAGSDELINMLDEYRSESLGGFRHPLASTELLYVGNTSYNLVYSYTLTIGSGYGFTGKTKRLVIYVRKDYIENFSGEYPVILSERVAKDSSDCVIC